MQPAESGAVVGTPGVVPGAVASLPALAAFPYYRRMAGNALAMGLGEALALALSLVLGGLVRSFWKGDPMLVSWMPLVLMGWLAGATVARLLPGWGLGPVEELRRTVILLVAIFAGTTAALFWGKAGQEASRLTLTTGFLFSLVLVPFARMQVKSILVRAGAWGIPAAVYAAGASSAKVIANLRAEPGLGYTPRLVFSDDVATGGEVDGLPVAGTLEDRSEAAAVAVLAGTDLVRERLTHLLDGPLARYRKVVVIPDLEESPTLWVHPRDLVGMLGLEMSSNLLDPLARALKRGSDILLVALTAPLSVPLLLLLALLVWLEDRTGPFFIQERVGYRGRRFRTWKFRTMRPDAEAALKAELDRDPALRAEWESRFKLRRDPRVTRVGAFLRRTSLDELPQFINVLAGEMSLVGPRPLPAYHYEELPERVRRLRDRVRPGITGLWQVSGRSDAGTSGMSRWDTYYVRNWSFWLDVVILVRTLRAVTSARGAY